MSKRKRIRDFGVTIGDLQPGEHNSITDVPGVAVGSRIVSVGGESFILGALVQTNYGLRRQLRIGGLEAGKLISEKDIPAPTFADASGASSIIVILATNAPLVGTQCARLARRATVELARAGGLGHDGSGDIFLAFSTGATFVAPPIGRLSFSMLANAEMNPLFAAAADTTEEAILNALCAAEDSVAAWAKSIRTTPRKTGSRAWM